jgi:hypothetical protein
VAQRPPIRPVAQPVRLRAEAHSLPIRVAVRQLPAEPSRTRAARVATCPRPLRLCRCWDCSA